MQTQCVPCGKVLSSPSVAAKHVVKHPPTRRASKSEWGTDAYVDGERWDAYAARTVPPMRAQKGMKTGVDSPAPDAQVLGHSDLRWDETECICDDHYPVIPSWQMTAERTR